ncbi:MAG TPA: excinuclease ABC subunit UvrC [Actinobacteria bacterium]|nr:excinuclease ABC subunit UvrC [Actinomycetota bacterium]
MERPRPSEIPDRPGVYLFRDRHGAVLYVGKARSLRKRIPNYFASELPPRTRAMMEVAASVEWILTETEVAAIMVEYALVQEHRPRYNIRLRDDKSFPHLAITVDDEWPRAQIVRGRKRRGVAYFGPYAHAHAIRDTLDRLLRTFPLRTCSDAKFRRHVAQGRPCLLYHIERCAGPCIGAVDPETYAEYVEGLGEFLSGRTGPVLERLESEMRAAADRREYELAARLRDQLASVRLATETQELVTERPEDFDVLAVAGDDLEVGVAVLRIRHGRVVGRTTMVVDRVEDVSEEGLVATLLLQLYGATSPPRLVLVPAAPADEAIVEWLAARRGGRVEVRVPRRGAKRRIMETATENAADELARHRLRRASDHNARARALEALQRHLELPEPPLRIECFDVSTIQGRQTVASMVVFEDGLPRRSDYRRFRIRTVEGQDDFAAMAEAVRRRFRAYLEERERPAGGRGRFAYPPSLLVVDGGAGQLSSTLAVLDELGLEIPAVGLAKRLEEVYLPGRSEPVRIPRGDDALYLLQRVRDEAHRFAVSYHRRLRSKRMVDSVLDEVPGVGPRRKRLLLRRFGSLRRLREADVDALADVVPRRVAEDLHAALHGTSR